MMFYNLMALDINKRLNKVGRLPINTCKIYRLKMVAKRLKCNIISYTCILFYDHEWNKGLIL